MIKQLREYFANRRQMDVFVNMLDVFESDRPLAQLWDVKAFADDGYRRNSLIFSCITIKAVTFMEPELLAYQEDREGTLTPLPPDHMLMQLLARPNARDSQSAMCQKWSICRDVAGFVALHKVRAAAGNVVGLQQLRPDCLWPVPDRTGAIRAYQYGKNKTERSYTEQEMIEGIPAQGNEPALLPAQDVIYEMAAPDPIDPLRGLSPIAVLASMGDIDNFAAKYLRAFFLNAGIPSGLLKFKTQKTSTERKKIRRMWRERYGLRGGDRSGEGGAWDVAVVDGDVDYQEIGSKLKMMDLEQVFGETETRICGTLGVHPILVAAWIGLMRSTMANYEQAVKHFYKTTMKPLWTSMADRLTIDLAGEFGPGIVIKFNLDSVPELQGDKTKDKEIALKAWDSSLATRNEARAVWGLSQLEASEGDVFKIKPTDTFEPVTLAPVQNARISGARLEFGALPGHSCEAHEAINPDDWRRLHQIADRATPALKKKSLRLLNAASPE